MSVGSFKYSFEFFPPKKDTGWEDFYATVEELVPLNPHFMSVTYGALGSNQDKTLDIVGQIQNEYGVNAVAHFTCIGTDEDKVNEFVQELKQKNVSRILALRGDLPQGTSASEVLHRFDYATDLIAYLKVKDPGLQVFCAGYPEGHPEAKSLDADLDNLKRKIDAGAEGIVTQLFFENRYFYDYVRKVRALGIQVPIYAGIMPLLNFQMIEKITQMCGVHVPEDICLFFQKEASEEEKKEFAFEFTLKQCRDLLNNGVDGIHFYTLNRCSVVKDVCLALKGGQSS